jgi:hypothetical protein
MSKKRTLVTAVCSIVTAVLLGIIGAYLSDRLNGHLGIYAIVLMVIVALIMTLVIYWPEPKKITKQSSLDINVAKVLAVRFFSEGNTQSGNLALILYDIKFVNSSDENATLKKILVRYKLNTKQRTVDSIVLLTGSVSSPQGKSDSIIVHFGNKKTALVNAAFDAATSNPDLSPLDFLLEVMRSSSMLPDWRIKAALAALPYVHTKPERAPATNPAATAGQIKGGPDPLYEALKAWQEGSAPARDRIERPGSKS